MDVELSLNVPKKYAQFNTELLSSWMTDIVQEDVGGKCVLTGKTTYAYSGGATGGFQSFSETKVVEIDVKGMNQGEELIPTFKVKVSGETEWKEKTIDVYKRQLLKEINKNMGVTIIVITHEMRVIEQICNKVAVIDKSHIVEEGPVREVFTAPKSQIAKQLILLSLIHI